MFRVLNWKNQRKINEFEVIGIGLHMPHVSTNQLFHICFFFSTAKVIQIQISLYAFFFFCHKGDFGPASLPKPSHSKPVGAVWPLLLQGAVHLNGVLGVLMDPESLQVDKTLGINLQ